LIVGSGELIMNKYELEMIEEIRQDIKDIKKELTGLQLFKAQIMGGCAVIALVCTSILNIMFGN
jgi:hypothetical protein